MLKPLILFFVMLFGVNSEASEKPYIISGFDDVLRQAENTSLLKAAKKILEEDKTFSGMPELYQVISGQESFPNFTLVSGISNWFDSRIDAFLLGSRYPSHRRYLRNWLTQWSIEDFKIEKIREVINERPQRSFIVIFDNSDPSLSMADKISTEFSGKVLAIYLHQVVGKKVPTSAIGYYTAFDIAFSEYKSGRLADDDVLKVGQAILSENNVEMLVPSYAECPKHYNSCDSQNPKVSELCVRVEDHLTSLCTH